MFERKMIDEKPVVSEVRGQHEPRPQRRRLKILVASIAAVALATTVAIVLSGPRVPTLPYNEVALTPHGPAIRVAPIATEWTLRSDGLLEPLEEANVTIETWGEITWLCVDGKSVEEGEVVLELDREDIDRSIADQEGELAIREASLIQTRQNAAKSIKSAMTAARRAEYDLSLEQMNRGLVVAGASETARARAIKDRDVRRLVEGNRVEELKILDELLAQGYATSAETDSKRLQLMEASLEAERAQAYLDKVLQGATELEVRQADLRVRIAEFTLESATRRVGSVEATSRGDVAVGEQRISSVAHEVERLHGRLKHYSVKAPKTGYVLHIPDRWGVPWVPGRPVGRGNKVMSIPVSGRVKVTTKVGQDDVDFISVGMPCRVTVLADADRPLHASVLSVSSQGRDEYEDLDSNTSAKVGKAGRDTFDVEIEVLATEPRLLPGFRAVVDYLVHKDEAVIVVPWGAVTRSGEASYVTVLADGQPLKRKVVLGRFDSVRASVVDGLAEGDVVLLALSGGRP